MDGELIRICSLALLCSVAVMILRQLRGEFVGLLRIAGAVLIFGALALSLRDTVSEVTALFQESDVGTYVSVMLRALGLAFLAGICADICRDCGENTVAKGVEMAGKVAILILCIPLISEILGYASQILEMS